MRDSPSPGSAALVRQEPERILRAWVGSDGSLAGCEISRTTTSRCPPGRSRTGSSSLPRPTSRDRDINTTDPDVDRRREPPPRRGPATLPSGRRCRGRVPRGVGAGGLLVGRGASGRRPPAWTRRAIQRAASPGRRGLRAFLDGVGVHLRRAHAPRHSERSLGPGRSGDHLPRPVDAATGLHRHAPTRLRGPGQLSARPVPRQRHDGRGPDRRPEFRAVQRADPVRRRT